LAPFALSPRLSRHLESVAQKIKKTRWIIGVVFIALGLWSIWFGLYVDPKDWSGT